MAETRVPDVETRGKRAAVVRGKAAEEEAAVEAEVEGVAIVAGV
jgi:hypothetical protein